jgi:putative N-acetylmannosamine-6-phosphate epimerase
LVSTRVAYSDPEQHKLVAQSWYPRQLLAADLAIFESTLYAKKLEFSSIPFLVY